MELTKPTRSPFYGNAPENSGFSLYDLPVLEGFLATALNDLQAKTATGEPGGTAAVFSEFTDGDKRFQMDIGLHTDLPDSEFKQVREVCATIVKRIKLDITTQGSAQKRDYRFTTNSPKGGHLTILAHVNSDGFDLHTVRTSEPPQY
jgi:hypothetical protein